MLSEVMEWRSKEETAQTVGIIKYKGDIIVGLLKILNTAEVFWCCLREY